MIDLKAREAGRTSRTYARIVITACVCVLCIILIAGLWPLHASSNQVSWLKNRNGLLIGHHGSIVSIGAFGSRDVRDDSLGTLEIWLQPSRADGRKTILSFDGSSHPGDPFSVQQNKEGLRIQRYNIDDQGSARTAWFTVGGVFHQNNPVFVTITLGEHDTSVYVDGALAKVSPLVGDSRNNFTGRLVVADAPATSNSWSGQILGLAIYHRQLAAAEIAKHWESWTKASRPSLAEDDAPVGLYLFNEATGRIVRNQLDSSTDLTIPSHYFVLHPSFLLAPWREYKPTWSYWQDIAVNIGGFVPLGLCFAAYFNTVRAVRRPRPTTIALGFAVSLTIEVLQAFLPTRSSGTTDLFTNTLGTAIGVMFYHSSFTQSLLAKARHFLGDFPQDPSHQEESRDAGVVSAA